MNMKLCVIILFVAIYIAGYGLARHYHYLVDYDGHNSSFSVKLFDVGGPIPGSILATGLICYWLFYPMHRIETLIRHGPIKMIRDR